MSLSQVLPDHVMVDTCTGSCFPPHFTCRARRVRTVQIQVRHLARELNKP